MLFSSPTYADVADRRRHQSPFSALERAQHDLNGKLGPVFPPSNKFNSCSDLLRQRFRCTSRTVCYEPFRKTLRNNVLHFLTKQFIPPVSELFFCLNV